MSTAPRRCHDCGSTGRETTFPGARKPHGKAKVDRCSDCLTEFERLAERLAEASGVEQQPQTIATRASYRAAYRHRAGQAQLDWVDQMVPPP